MSKIRLYLLIALTNLSVFYTSVCAQEIQAGKIGESELYEFYSNFWFNMHHFFKQESLINSVKGTSVIEKATLDKMTTGERSVLQAVIEYYKTELLDEDLRTSDLMSAFKQWIIGRDEERLTDIPESLRGLSEQLQNAAAVYRKYFWADHQAANKAVLEQNLDLIKGSEKRVSERLSDLTKSYWDNKKIRVDISYYAKASERNLTNRPYTSLFPTHVVMNSSGKADTPRGNWLELLYHESSHHLILSSGGFVGGTIRDISQVSGQRSPRQLWHAYLFYFSGVVTQAELKKQGFDNYELYMVRNKVFSSYIPFLLEYLPSYIEHKVSLHKATTDIVEAIRKSRE
ncbi:hypothetical protein GWK08_14840 [Leptobacterium flavescens]|uniref:DUF4932 domain-containing protein n=1 Tax=Leptobacterium flavescens TaxID=472055 RepID=A0A6P0UMX9_9FLAO|nr:hypothetical protein [Leptobacterium flavescens]NER14731.1 hypothetical protein [Leptobacterium flavescens]